MQYSEGYEDKKKESIRLKKLAKDFSMKLARKKAEEVFVERVQPMTMFTDDRKRKFIEKITLQYEPIFYRNIINKIIGQKVMEEQMKTYNKKNLSEGNKYQSDMMENIETEYKEDDVEQSIINSSREVYNLLKNDNKEEEDLDDEEISESILKNLEECENIEKEDGNLVMSILNKETNV